jgi:hypothetical protein
MRRILWRASRSWIRPIRITIVLLGAVLSLGTLNPGADADEGVARIVPVQIDLPPADTLGPILDVNLLSDGRVAMIGYVTDSRDTYIRVYDPRTRADEVYVEPLEGGLQPADGIDRTIAIAGDSLFVYGIKAKLLRAPLDAARTVSSSMPAGDTAGRLTRLQGYDLSGIKRISGAMAPDHDTILVGWWEGAYDKLHAGDCGAGAILRRVSADGREIWRWQDPRGGFSLPKDIVALADGTILLRVNRGYGWGWVPDVSERCFGDSSEIVSLSPDGHEVGRLDLSPFLCLGPLSLSADGRDAVALAQTDDEPYAVVQLGMEEGRLRLRSLNLPEKIPDIGCQSNAATTTLQGGYRITASYDGLLTLDDRGHPLAWEPFPSDRAMECKGHGDQGVICWRDNRVAILSLVAMPAPAPRIVPWQIDVPGVEAGIDRYQVQRIERLPNGRFAVIGRISTAANSFLQIVDPDGKSSWSVGLHDEGGFDVAGRFSHAVAMTNDAIFLAQGFGSLWRVSLEDHADRLLEPFGAGRQIWWSSALPVGSDVYAAGWEGDDDPGSCGKGARVARLSSAGELVWSWQESQTGFRSPRDMILLGGGSLLVVIDSRPPADLFGEDMSYCYEGAPADLVLIGPEGKELDRMALPRGFDLGQLSQNGDDSVTALALQAGLDPDLVVTIRIQGGRIILERTPIQTALPVIKDSAIVVRILDGYRLLLHSHMLTLDQDGHLVAKRRRHDVAGHCEIVASQGDFCWTADQIFFQPLQ